MYNENYSSIFASSRNLLDDKVVECIEVIDNLRNDNIKLSLDYLCVVADYLTAYNELSVLSFFVKLKHFRPLSYFDNINA